MYQSGYWSPARSFDTIPTEALIFGESDEELSNVIGFSSDPEMMSFAVHYEDDSLKRIGRAGGTNTDTMFKILGKGGERVTSVEVGMNHLPMAIKVSTVSDHSECLHNSST